MATQLPEKPEGYDEFLGTLKERIRTAQVDAAQAVNRGMIMLYWSIGNDILERQRSQGWGAKVVDRLAADLRRAFPYTRGFSVRNLKYMRSLAEDWPDAEIVQQLLHKLPWFHLCALHDRVKDPAARLWYARKTLENCWSRNVLCIHIDRELYEAQGAATSNFAETLPAPQSDLARQLIKDPYKLDFLGIAEEAEERAIERGLVRHIRDFLLELGQGFAFVGNQVPLEIGGEGFRLDLLFYHLRLRCFLVIELKAGKFRPDYVGKLNFYLSAVDDILRHPDDQPSIGMILCKDRNDVVAEYSLRGTGQPMAVSQFELTKSLPAGLAGKLPSVDEIAAELASNCDKTST